MYRKSLKEITCSTTASPTSPTYCVKDNIDTDAKDV